MLDLDWRIAEAVFAGRYLYSVFQSPALFKGNPGYHQDVVWGCRCALRQDLRHFLSITALSQELNSYFY
ncbi:hypothetical protein CCP4SC76_600036 [Gammaproteobacteria bacterium]